MMTRLLLLPLTLALAAVACDNSGPIERGNLTVIDSTLGTPDPDGYVLSVEGQADRLLAHVQRNRDHGALPRRREGRADRREWRFVAPDADVHRRAGA